MEQMFLNGGKYTKDVQQKFVNQFPDAKLPHRNVVRKLIDKFRETGSVADAPQSGRPLTSEETVLDIQDRILMSPSKSVRRLSQQAHVPKSTAHGIMKKNLKLHPYKVFVVHELQERDHQCRVNCCIWFQIPLLRKVRKSVM